MVWFPIAALAMLMGAFAFIIWDVWRHGRKWDEEEKDRLRAANR